MKDKTPQNPDRGNVIDLEAKRLRKAAEREEKTGDMDEKDDGSREWFYDNQLRLGILHKAFPHLYENRGLQYRIQRAVDEIRGLLGKSGMTFSGEISLELRHDDPRALIEEVQKFIRELVDDEEWNFPLIALKNEMVGYAKRKAKNVLTSDEVAGLRIRASNEKVHQSRTGKADFFIRKGEGSRRIRECDLRKIFCRKNPIASEGETVRTALEKTFKFTKIIDQ